MTQLLPAKPTGFLYFRNTTFCWTVLYRQDRSERNMLNWQTILLTGNRGTLIDATLRRSVTPGIARSSVRLRRLFAPTWAATSVTVALFDSSGINPRRLRRTCTC